MMLLLLILIANVVHLFTISDEPENEHTMASLNLPLMFPISPLTHIHTAAGHRVYLSSAASAFYFY